MHARFWILGVLKLEDIACLPLSNFTTFCFGVWPNFNSFSLMQHVVHTVRKSLQRASFIAGISGTISMEMERLNELRKHKERSTKK